MLLFYLFSSDAPANNRPNVFTNILKASRDRTVPTALQAEIHYRSTKDFTRFTILLNNMRLMGIFDWLLCVKDFLMTSPENPFAKKGMSLGIMHGLKVIVFPVYHLKISVVRGNLG